MQIAARRSSSMTKPFNSIFLLTTLLFSCAGGHNTRDVQASQEAHVTVVSTRQAILEQTLLEHEKMILQMQDAVRARGRNSAEALENIEQVAERIRFIQGALEEMRFELDDLKAATDAYQKQQEARQLHDELRLRQLERSLGLTPPPRPVIDGAVSGTGTVVGEEGAGEDTDTPEPAEALPDSARGKLDLAVEHMKAGKQGLARFMLQMAIEEHAGDPLLPEIRYRMGETWFNEQEYAKAALAFNEVVDNHQKSRWVPWAIMRQGESFMRMENDDGALMFLEDTVALYPKSDAASEAKDLIKDIKKRR
jgi:TolA-binding protein